jgi:hypothetical protein
MASDIGKMHFQRMDEGTDADFAVLARVHEENIRKLPDLLIGLMTNLKADAAYPVDRLQHSLQTATRALRDGRDEEYVVCAVLHDLGSPSVRSTTARWWPRSCGRSCRRRTAGCSSTTRCSRYTFTGTT